MNDCVKFVRGPTEAMETPIPEGVPYSTIPTGEYTGEGEEQVAVTRQKVLREFIFSHMTTDLDDGTTVFLLACKTHSTYRIHGVTEADLIDWDSFLSPYGHGRDTWLTLDERNELLPKEEEL